MATENTENTEINNRVSARSGLILDAVEAGNPADSQRFMPMLERHQAHYGSMPRQIAADGDYATAANLADAKDAGVEDVAFHKKRGLAIADMVEGERAVGAYIQRQCWALHCWVVGQRGVGAIECQHFRSCRDASRASQCAVTVGDRRHAIQRVYLHIEIDATHSAACKR